MKLVFSDHAWEDYLYWQQNDQNMVKRINCLLTETKRNPFSGIGKPEALKHSFKGYWSRRITDEHRFVYKVTDDSILIAQLRYHY
ncbi:MAG TPA: Txe/YoeB family addiction module toxin [Treponemataceae bacterium]|mgnify:FL=1|jgi:toxin YoeB|nr:Txe/YoeB family addiction module toxin [Treponemataceae bacterium]